MNRLWLELQRGKVFRRLTLVWCLWMTTHVFNECFHYVMTHQGDTVSTAAIIAAFLGPLSGLMGFVSHIYASSQAGSELIEKGNNDAKS